MKRVIALLLACLLAAGGIIAAHAVITDAQDEILFYPTFEWGDPAPLQDRVLNLGFGNRSYLHWDSRYRFGDGSAQTVFTYGKEEDDSGGSGQRNEFSVYLSMQISTSTSHHFELLRSDYGAMVRAAAEGLGENESRTVELNMKDYVRYYQPDLDIYYRDAEKVCSMYQSPYRLMDMVGWDAVDEDNYNEFNAYFRFPVREEEIVKVTAHKSDIGLIDSYGFQSTVDTKLQFYGTATAEGIYFLPVFQEEPGMPLDYESPAGPGLYFAPWKPSEEDTLWYDSDGAKPLDVVVPDMSQAVLLTPIDPALSIQDFQLDVEADRLWLLTRDEDSFDLQILTVSTGETIARTVAIPRREEQYAWFELEGAYILVTSDTELALLDLLGKPLLTAPIARHGERYHIPSAFNPIQDALWFDGETLILTCRSSDYNTAFWVCVYQEGKLLYHGEFDSSLTRTGEYVSHEGKMSIE